MKVKNNARQGEIASKKAQFKSEQDAIKQRLAAKYGDKFKVVEKEGAKVVISKEAAQKSKEAIADKPATSRHDPKSEETKERLRGLLGSGTFAFNDKERAALKEILG